MGLDDGMPPLSQAAIAQIDLCYFTFYLLSRLFILGSVSVWFGGHWRALDIIHYNFARISQNPENNASNGSRDFRSRLEP